MASLIHAKPLARPGEQMPDAMLMTVSARATGVSLITIGAVVMLGWWLRLPTVVRINPAYPPMVFNTALCFVLAGTALAVLVSRGNRYLWIATLAGVLLISISAATLFEHRLHRDLGIDFVSLHSWLREADQNPGRMSLASACGFALGGMAILLMSRRTAFRWVVAMRLLSHSLGLVAVLGISGYLVQARLLFPEYPFAGMALHTAIGLMLLTMGLHSARRQFAWGRTPLFRGEDDEATFVGALILATIACTAGILSFALLQNRVQGVVSAHVLTTLHRRSEMFQELLKLRDVNARIAATRPGVLRNLQVIRSGQDDGSNLANVEAVIANFLQQGFSGLAYHDAEGRISAAGGVFAQQPAMIAPLSLPDSPELIWDHGFVLRHRLRLQDAAGDVGTLIVEQPLPVLTNFTRGVPAIGQTGDMGLCIRKGEGLQCFPQGQNPTVFSAPLTSSAGDPLPMTRALSGETGIVIARDFREHNVVAAYGPVDTLGLGMVVKVDAAEIFQPFREQLQTVLGSLIVLVTVGTLLLRRQVKPFATRLLAAKQALEEKNSELENANLAKNRFLASMSHELRTPLNAIIGFTGTLLMKLPGPLNDPQERQLTIVQTSARHLLSLINDLLDLAKIEAGKVELHLELIDCRAVVEEVAASLRQQAEAKKLKFEVIAPATDVTARTDRRMLSQILLNLAGNAIKFTESGYVRIETSKTGIGEVVIAVSDTGVGIRAEDRQRIFAVFTQLHDNRREGSGLGLHLSRKFAELLGGKLNFASEHGKGSRFTLTLSSQ